MDKKSGVNLTTNHFCFILEFLKKIEFITRLVIIKVKVILPFLRRSRLFCQHLLVYFVSYNRRENRF